jgi:glyceraldehyde-3-phosphate dehydrogenase [NAD(P)+]
MTSAVLSLKNSIFDSLYRVGDDGELYFKTFLAGDFLETESYIDVYSPIDENLIAKVPKIKWSELDSTLEKLYNEGRWAIRDIPGEARLENMYRIANLMEKCSDDFAHTLIINAGKTEKQANSEVGASIDRLRKADLDVGRPMGDYLPGDWSSHTLESEGIVKREPYGVVLAITPFNYPLFDAVNKFVYSVIVGNAFIVKPPSADPIPMLLFSKILKETLFPPKAFAVATSPRSEASKLLSDPRIHVVTLTGSTETGLHVLRQSGIKQFIMELGGGDPAIVLEDADLNLAASKITTGITSYSGQRCDAIKLVLAENAIFKSLKEKIIRELSNITVGDPREKTSTIGPLIRAKSVDIMIDSIDEALKQGGRLLIGGDRLGPTYVKPALIEMDDKKTLRQLRLYKEEVFAPISLITKVEDVDEAIKLANGRRYGLDAAIFGENNDKIRKLMRYLEVGAIYINEYPRHGIGYYPFGGRKDSGVGREGLGYSINHVTALKTIVYNYRGKGIWEYL